MDAETLLKLNAPDEATQRARLAAVRGKNVLWVSPFTGRCVYSEYGRKHYYGMLRDLGANLWMIVDPTFENTEEIVRGMTNDGYMERGGIVWANLRDHTVCVDSCYAAVKKITEERGVEFHAVCGTGDHIQAIVGGLAERLGLPHNPPRAYDIARDKLRSRVVCRAAGVPMPKFAHAHCRGDLGRIIKLLKLPLVIKPASGAGSLGVYKCATRREVYRAFDAVRKDMNDYDTLTAYSCFGKVAVLCEQYIDGDEFDADLLMWDGECVYGAITDNWPTFEPFFLENGANTPTAFPHLSQPLLDYAVAVVKAMGFRMGGFHVELKYSHRWKRPVLIEVNPRVGGECICPFNQDVYGVDLMVEHVLASFDVPINPPRALVPRCARVLYSICAPRTGVLLHDRFLDHIKLHPAVVETEVCVKPGEVVQGMDTAIPQWVGKFTVKGDDIYEAIAVTKGMVPTIDCPIQPGGPRKPMAKVPEAQAPQAQQLQIVVAA